MGKNVILIVGNQEAMSELKEDSSNKIWAHNFLSILEIRENCAPKTYTVLDLDVIILRRINPEGREKRCVWSLHEDARNPCKMLVGK
jgi:hypothetical protein